MAILIPEPHEYFAGNNIRKARKRFACDGWTAKPNHRKIEPGEYYAEGDHDIDHANGFGRNRYCFECAEVPLLLDLNGIATTAEEGE